MNDEARRTQLKQEYSLVDHDYRAALVRLDLAAREREKVIRQPKPLEPLSTPGSSDYLALAAADEDFEKWDAEVTRLRGERERLLRELARR
jgi:hypothetical protein